MGVINLGLLVDKIKRKLLNSGFITSSDKASKSKFGIVKIGDGINVSNGVISVTTSNNYSTIEKEVGLWTDGTTKVYEKTFVLSDQSVTAYTDVTMGELPGVDRVIDIAGSLSSSDKSVYYANEYSSTAGKYSYFYVSKDETNTVLFKSTDNWSSTNLIVTVRYTKTA